MENKNILLVLAVSDDFVMGLDGNLNWVRMPRPAGPSIGILDVLDIQSMQRLRAANPDILSAPKFTNLFDGEKFIHAKNIKIYKSDDVFKCDFDGRPAYGMTDARFYIDGYTLDAADIIVMDGMVVGIFPSAAALNAPIVVAAPKKTMPEIENRMAELYNAAMEYEQLKKELVARIKENCATEKRIVTGGFFKAVYTPPGIRRTVDSDKMKADGIYENYVKISQTSASVRIIKLSEDDAA